MGSDASPILGRDRGACTERRPVALGSRVGAVGGGVSVKWSLGAVDSVGRSGREGSSPANGLWGLSGSMGPTVINSMVLPVYRLMSKKVASYFILFFLTNDLKKTSYYNNLNPTACALIQWFNS